MLFIGMLQILAEILLEFLLDDESSTSVGLNFYTNKSCFSAAVGAKVSYTHLL